MGVVEEANTRALAIRVWKVRATEPQWFVRFRAGRFSKGANNVPTLSQTLAGAMLFATYAVDAIAAVCERLHARSLRHEVYRIESWPRSERAGTVRR
jgi:hypothetical protein